MDALSRRNLILEIIQSQSSPISASSLAQKLNVSRQIIVGDVALLRAQGHDIIATARGYIFPKINQTNQFIAKIACCHTPEDTKDELYIIVDLGATVVNTLVEHDIYGELAGSLNLESRYDVDEFIHRLNQSETKLLSELTSGIHLHTISCRNNDHFQQVKTALKEKNYLLSS